ncbi:hypothetical protein H2198_004251 [Neophaeococcomyces mojaviensis]|uniref:Uncharacterized protein n=1 Tax=Neophaeococcomyces mojaviensis TaxID=3383035 RepID=A0ACC3A9G6_9EURO|nr:hypothetical protein H2198_004251 [Knufia sp. JES_112]
MILDKKIRVAAHYGFKGIEIVYSDLSAYSSEHNVSMIQGAESIRSLCDELGIEILSLAPFENFEGTISPSLQERIAIAQQWIDIARKLRAPHLQVPAQYGKEGSDCTTNIDTIVSELQQLADLAGDATDGQQQVVKIAFEPMSWSTSHSTWESVVELINLVDRSNFGLCLDSFHIITKIWASPFDAITGTYPDADRNLKDSLTQFKDNFPLEKLFYVQLSDGERFDPPFSKDHPWYIEDEAPEFTWSKHARPFPGETELGGYFPVGEFLRLCVEEKGFKGWISIEIFDRRMKVSGHSMEEAAKRARKSWESLLRPVEKAKT